MSSVKLLLVTLYVASCLSATADGSSGFRYDYSFSSDADGWLKLHRVPTTWDESRLQCDIEGSVLASPTNKHVLGAMLDLQRRYASGCIFTGLFDYFSQSNYLSREGVPLLKMPVEWAEDEPNNELGGEHCIILTDNGTVADVNCSERFPFVCYKKKTDDMVVTECGTVDKKYKFEPETGSCYKFHHNTVNWTRAFRTCAAEGAHLAIINCDKEAKLMKKLFDDNVSKILFEGNKAVTHLGFHKWKGIWYTIEGALLEDAGYNNWAPKQPDYSNSEACGAMFRDGTLDDTDHTYEASFICEKRPNSLISDDN